MVCLTKKIDDIVNIYNIENIKIVMTETKLTVMLAALLLEDIGQTALQFTFYEQFATSLDWFTLFNAIVMVLLHGWSYYKVAMMLFKDLSSHDRYPIYLCNL